MNIFQNKKINPEAEAKIRTMIEELKIQEEVFKNESKIRLNHLEEDIAETKHDINVTRSELKEDVIHALKKMNAAAEAIVLPE